MLPGPGQATRLPQAPMAPHHVSTDDAILGVGRGLPTLMVAKFPLAGPAIAGTGDAPGGGVVSRVRCTGMGLGWGAGWATKGLRHSRQVLHQAHGLPAVVEGVQMGGKKDVAVSEEELDIHSHVVCRWGQRQVGPQSAGQGWQGGRRGARGQGGLELGLLGPNSSPIIAPNRPSNTEPEAERGDPPVCEWGPIEAASLTCTQAQPGLPPTIRSI